MQASALKPINGLVCCRDVCAGPRITNHNFGSAVLNDSPHLQRLIEISGIPPAVRELTDFPPCPFWPVSLKDRYVGATVQEYYDVAIALIAFVGVVLVLIPLSSNYFGQNPS